MATLPTPIRAALGLAATAIDEARKLPETLPQLPVAVIGTAMQASLRVQQHIAEYASRGDELLSQLRGAPEEAPSWATFDDAGSSNDAAGNGSPTKAAFELVDEEVAIAEDAEALAQPPAPASVPVEPAAAATAAPAKKAAKKAAAKTTTAKPGATKATAAKPAKKTPIKKSEPLAVAAERAEPTDRPNPSTLAAEIVQAHESAAIQRGNPAGE